MEASAASLLDTNGYHQVLCAKSFPPAAVSYYIMKVAQQNLEKFARSKPAGCGGAGCSRNVRLIPRLGLRIVNEDSFVASVEASSGREQVGGEREPLRPGRRGAGHIFFEDLEWHRMPLSPTNRGECGPYLLLFAQGRGRSQIGQKMKLLKTTLSKARE